MAGQHIQINKTTGKAQIRGATGKAVFAADGAACGCGCVSCDGNGTPTTVKVVLAGWSAVNTCTDCSSWGDGYNINTFNINGTYCLPLCSSETCEWGDSFDGLISITARSAILCSGTTGFTATRIAIWLSRYGSGASSGWNFQILSSEALSYCAGIEPCGMDPGGRCVASNMMNISASLANHPNCMDAVSLGSITASCTTITVGTVDITPNGC